VLIYDSFVFVHMPKTAGTFLAEALSEDLYPPVDRLEPHTGWDAIPTSAAGLPGLMYVRNPWDWYVSWYHFWTESWLPRHWADGSPAPPLVRLLLGEQVTMTRDGLRGEFDFATMIRGACGNLTPDHPVIAELIEEEDPRLAGIQFGNDFYTTRFKQLAGAGLVSDLLTIGRYESLIDDLEQFFVHNEIPVAADAVARIKARQPVNTSPHRPYRDYYDDDLRDLVGDSCRTLIDRFDYVF